MSTFRLLHGEVRSVRVLTDMLANVDESSEDDNDSVDSEVSDIEDESALEIIVERNTGITSRIRERHGIFERLSLQPAKMSKLF